MSKMRKRRNLTILLLIIALVVFAYARREVFFRQAKNLIKQKLEKSFSPAKLSIGKLRAGLFYGLVLENLRINFPQSHFGFAFNIEIDEAYLDYKKHKDVQEIRFKGGRISFGNAPILLKKLQGKMLLSRNSLAFEDIKAIFKDNPQNALKFYGEFSQDEFTLTANLQHLKLGNFDVLSNFTLALNKKLDLPGETRKVCGTFKTYGSVVNNRPFPELSSSFEIQEAKLRILTFSLGNNYDLRGIADLSAPFNVDLSLNFYRAAPDELISQLIFSPAADFSGSINGLIKITGPLSRPKVEGYLEAKEGHLGDLSFVSADINIEGRYPRILIVDSRICREEDSFLMEGEIDFSNLGQGLACPDFLDIKVEADTGMLWQGWDITRNTENQMHMSKSIADDLKITFDTFAEDTSKEWENNYTNELGLQYKVFGDKLLKIRLKKDEGILGVERRIRF